MSRLAWITGAAGLIGHAVVTAAHDRAMPWIPRPLTRGELDLTDTQAVTSLFQRESPGLIIHCAALSRSPDCQGNPELAYRINVAATAHLCQLAEEIPLLCFSSDLVFDGRQGHYTEADATRPLSVYGETKVAAERLTLRNPKHLVIRTSITAGTSLTGDRSFTEQMLSAWQQQRSLSLFTDEFRSPIAAEATARAVWELLEQGVTGLFHVAGSERLSRWEIGQLLAAAHPELTARIRPASILDYVGAPRPADTSLDCAKAQALLSFPLPSLRDWLTHC